MRGVMLMNKKRMKRYALMVRLFLSNDGLKKSDMVKKSGLFGLYGDGNYWFPRVLPAEPSMVRIHNNVHVATDAYFCTHDVMQRMFDAVPEYYELLPETVKSAGGVIPITQVKLKYSTTVSLALKQSSCME